MLGFEVSASRCCLSLVGRSDTAMFLSVSNLSSIFHALDLTDLFGGPVVVVSCIHTYIHRRMWKLISLCAGADITLGISKSIAEALDIEEQEIALMDTTSTSTIQLQHHEISEDEM